MPWHRCPRALESCGGAKVNLQGLVGLLPSYTAPRKPGSAADMLAPKIEMESPPMISGRFTLPIRRGDRSRHTFASGESATPPGGKKSGRSRRATPIRSSAIP